MSCRLTALSVFVLLVLGAQSINLTDAPSFPLPPFDFPDIDGSAVDTCRIFPEPVPDTTTTFTTTTATTAATTTPITRRQAVATTKKPAVQSPPRKPVDRPIRPQPPPAGPVITDSHANHINRLLHLLLANSRRHPAGSHPAFVPRPIGRQPHRGRSDSDSDESAAAPQKSAGKRWKKASLSSEDSSDES